MALRPVQIALGICLLLNVLVVMPSPASAQTPDPSLEYSCTEGTLVGTDCVIDDGSPIPGQSTCPAGAIQPGCYSVVPGTQTCPEGSDDVGGECRVPVAFEPGPSVCPAVLDGQVCYQVVASESTCPEGSDDVGGECRVPVAFEPGPSVCPAVLDGQVCYQVVASESTCPEGSDDVGGECRVPVAFEPGPSVCPAVTDGQACYQVVEGTLICPLGSNPVDVSCQVPVAPEPGAAVCPAGTFVADDGSCYEVVPVAIVCPVDPVAVLVDGECREDVAFEPGAAVCPAGTFVADDGSCYMVVPADVSCPADASVFEVDGECREDVAFEPGAAVCPAGTFVADDGSCYMVVPADVGCPDAGSLVNGECREPVPLVPGTPTCSGVGFDLVGGTCQKTIPADSCTIGAQNCGGEAAIAVEQSTPTGDGVAKRPTEVTVDGCPDGTGTWQLTDLDGNVVLGGSLTEGPAGFYSTTFTSADAGTYVFSSAVSCPTGEVEDTAATIDYIDPAGFVLDCVGQALAGVPVTLYRSEDEAGPYAAVADGDTTVMDPVNTANPTITDAGGFYQWFVTAGWYYVEAVLPTGETVRSANLPVPPPQLEVDLLFTTVNCASPEPEPEPEPDATPESEPTAEPTAEPVAYPTIVNAPGTPVSLFEAPAPDASPSVDAPIAAPASQLAHTGGGRSGASFGLLLVAAGAFVTGMVRRTSD